MKEVLITIDDKLYRRASRGVCDLDAVVNQHVTEYLESVNGADDDIVAARTRMAELFARRTNFTVGTRPKRGQMHER